MPTTRIKNLLTQAGFIGEGFQRTVIGTCQETALENFVELLAEDLVQAVLNNQMETPNPDDPNNPFYLGWVRGCIDAAHVIRAHCELDQ
jgi:hypothetical protein